MYSIVSEDNKENNRAKHVNKSVISKGNDDKNDDKIKFEVYEYVLLNKKIMGHRVKRNLSKSHRIGPYDVCKIALSYFDDKRYKLDDGINS